MKKLALIFVTITLFAVCAMAKTVKLADYTTPDDGKDDSAGFQSAINVLKNNKGGTLEIGGGVWNLSQMVNMVAYGNYVSYRIVGDAGSVIRLNLPQTEVAFYVGNVNQLIFENLIFTGDGSLSNYDTGFLLLANYTDKLSVRNCHFFGIRAGHSLFYIGNIDARFENNQFYGNASDVANIYGAFDMVGLLIENTNFRDYGGFLGDYISKTPNGNSSWIKVERDAEDPALYQSSRVRISDVRLDEGAYTGISLKNVPIVEISGLTVNVSGVTSGVGILFDNVKYAIVTNSAFGFTTLSRPALKLLNNSHVTVSRLKFGGNVYFSDIDASSEAKISFCPECERKGNKQRANILLKK